MVITIILIVSAVALPTVLPALSHRQVSEAARIFQGALVGARDSAIHNNAPSGIRLLPDPAFPHQRYAAANGTDRPDPAARGQPHHPASSRRPSIPRAGELSPVNSLPPRFSYPIPAWSSLRATHRYPRQWRSPSRF